MIPQCDQPVSRYSGDGRRGTGRHMLVRIILRRLGSGCFELFDDGFVSGIIA